MKTHEYPQGKLAAISRNVLLVSIYSESRPPVVVLRNLRLSLRLGLRVHWAWLRLRLQRGLDLQRAHALLLGVGAGEGHRAGGVGGVVQQGVDLVDKEGVEALGDLFLVGEGEGTLEGDPVGRVLDFSASQKQV
jgi:hypothetical protein